VIDVWALRGKEEAVGAVGKCKFVDDILYKSIQIKAAFENYRKLEVGMNMNRPRSQ
jgi:hypothetical protein